MSGELTFKGVPFLFDHEPTGEPYLLSIDEQMYRKLKAAHPDYVFKMKQNPDGTWAKDEEGE